MSKTRVTLKALTDKLEQNPREAFTVIAAIALNLSNRIGDVNENSLAEQIIDRLFPPEPEWKPLRLEWEQDGAKLRFRRVEIDERDDRSKGFIWPAPCAKGAFKIDMYSGGRTGFDNDTLRIVIGCFDRTWSDWKTFPSESDAIAFYDKARMAVYELNTKRGCKSDLPYNKLRKIEQPWTPLIITFRKNSDDQWEGQILSQDERDRVDGDAGSKEIGRYAGVWVASCDSPEWIVQGTASAVFYLRGEDRSLDLQWFPVGPESDKRKIQAAVRELNSSRGIELAQ